MIKHAVITGHSRGIGQTLSDFLKQNHWTTQGFSRSNGYDLKNSACREKVVAACQNANLFVNNAHVDFVQTQLLYKVFDIWKNDKNKTILNIGVDSVPSVYWEVTYRSYSTEKVALHAAISDLQNQVRKCRIINLSLGHMDTESNKENVEKVKMKDLQDVVNWLLNTPEQIEIKNLTLAAR